MEWQETILRFREQRKCSNLPQKEGITPEKEGASHEMM